MRDSVLLFPVVLYRRLHHLILLLRPPPAFCFFFPRNEVGTGRGPEEGPWVSGPSETPRGPARLATDVPQPLRSKVDSSPAGGLTVTEEPPAQVPAPNFGPRPRGLRCVAPTSATHWTSLVRVVLHWYLTHRPSGLWSPPKAAQRNRC